MSTAKEPPAEQPPKKGYQKREYRVAINKRLHAEGRFEEMRAFRDSLMAKGYDPHWAFRTAAMHFPPLDGTPLEFDARKTAAHYLVWKDQYEAKTAAGEKPQPRQKPPGPELGAAKVIAELAQAAGISPEEKMRPWNELRQRVDFARKCSPMDAARWVFDVAGTPVEDISPEEVPSRGALRLLRHVNTSDAKYSEFLTTFVVKTIPDKRQLEYDARFADDGRKQLEMIEEVEREFVEQEAAASDAESSG